MSIITEWSMIEGFFGVYAVQVLLEIPSGSSKLKPRRFYGRLCSETSWLKLTLSQMESQEVLIQLE